jgi:hypothetical protein
VRKGAGSADGLDRGRQFRKVRHPRQYSRGELYNLVVALYGPLFERLNGLARS